MKQKPTKKPRYVKMLELVTFSVHHNPNCPKPFEVRLLGKFATRIDNFRSEKTQDVIGHGMTFEKAAKEAWNKRFGS